MPLELSGQPDNARSSNTIHTYSITDENDAILIVLNDIDNHTISRLYIKHKDGSKTDGVKVELSKDNDLSKRNSIVSGDVTEDSHFFIPSFNKYILIQGLEDKNPVEVQFISTSGFTVYDKKDNWDFEATFSYIYEIPKHPDYPDNYVHDEYQTTDIVKIGVEAYLYNWHSGGRVYDPGTIRVDINNSKLTSSDNLYEIPITFNIYFSVNNVNKHKLIGTPKYDFLPKCTYEYYCTIPWPGYGR